jgi:hypothetical protein
VEEQGPAQRSTFVTVLAWLLIAFAGFATLIGLMQNIMIHTVMPFDRLPADAPGMERMPGFFRFLFSNVHLVFLSFLVLSAVALVSAIGLLKRKNWSRLVFIGLFGLGILWNIAGVVLQQVMMSSMSTPAGAPPEFENAATFMLIFGVLFAAAFSALFGWLMFKLLSRRVRAEFLPSA